MCIDRLDENWDVKEEGGKRTRGEMGRSLYLLMKTRFQPTTGTFLLQLSRLTGNVNKVWWPLGNTFRGGRMVENSTRAASPCKPILSVRRTVNELGPITRDHWTGGCARRGSSWVTSPGFTEHFPASSPRMCGPGVCDGNCDEQLLSVQRHPVLRLAGDMGA